MVGARNRISKEIVNVHTLFVLNPTLSFPLMLMQFVSLVPMNLHMHK